MAIVDLWHRISHAGVRPGMDDRFCRKIQLTNQIGVLAGAVILVLSLAYRIVLQADLIMILVMFTAVAGYCLVPVLNRVRLHGVARGLLNFIPPATIIVITGILSDAPVTATKFALLSVIVVPVLVYGVEELGKMLIGIVWVALCFPGMDALTPIIPTPAGLNGRYLDSALSLTMSAWVSCVMLTIPFIYFQRLNITAEKMLELEKAKADRLLLNVLPRDIAAMLKESDQTIAEHFKDTSILFADIVGFTPLSARIHASAVVDLLNELFSEFDRMADELGVEKIKTIGDCYMAAAGVPRPRHDHANALIRLALAMRACMNERAFQGLHLSLRIGINSGAVTAGVIGRKKFIYDLWGDTVNTASRMESQGAPGAIQITDSTHALIEDEFECSSAGVIDIKGKGPMQIWHVLGLRQDCVPPSGIRHAAS